MASLSDIFGNAKGLKGLLSDEEIGSVQGDSLLQASLALMAAGGPSASPVSFGQALANAYGKGREAFKGGIESQVGNLLTAQKIKEAQRQQKLQEAFTEMQAGLPEYVRDRTSGEVSPQQAISAPGMQAGPTVERAAMIGQPMPRISEAKANAEYYRMQAPKFAAVDPERAQKLLEYADKLDPKFKTQSVQELNVGGKPMKFAIGEDGSRRELGAATEDLIQVNAGDKVLLVTKNTAQQIGAIPVGMSPSDRTAAGNLAVNQARLGLEQERFAFDKSVGKPAPEAFSKGAVAYYNLSNALNKYESIIAKGGITALPGEKKQELQTLNRDIQLMAKEAYNLGVLNGPDLQILESVIIDPTSLGSNFNPAVGTKGVLNNIKRVKEIVERQRQSLQSTYGREIPQTKPYELPPVNRNIGGGVAGFGLGELPMNAIEAELRRRGQ